MRKRPFVTIAFAFAALSPFVALPAREEWTATEANIDSRRGVLREEAVKGDFLLKVRTRHGDYDELNDVFRFQILLNQEFAAELKEEKEEWRSGCPQWISESERFRFAVESGAARTTGKSGEATPKNATEPVKAKHGEIIREGDLVACRYILAIHAYGPGYEISEEEEPSKCGHVWISIYDLAKGGEETTYGLWPDYAEDANKYRTKPGSCLLKNYELNKLKCKGQRSRYYLLSALEYELFMKDVLSQSMPGITKKGSCYWWELLGSNCASYGAAATELATEDPISPFIDTPEQVIESINKEEKKTMTSQDLPLYDRTFHRGK